MACAGAGEDESEARVSLIARYRRWQLNRQIRRAETAMRAAPPEAHGAAWDKAAALHLKRDDLDPVVRGSLEAILARRPGH